MMAFQQLQRQFLAHCRHPEQQALPEGFAQQGAAIYVDLLYNKFNDSLESCFPVTLAILGDSEWQKLLKNFIAQHRCLSPYYRQIPDEFISYLQTECDTLPLYLLELAHFEWIEMVLAISDAETVASSSVDNWLDCRPVFASVLQLLHYAFPVQQINVDYQPTEPPEQATHIVGFRDGNDVVQFIELNSATARLLAILHTTHCTVHEAISQIATELQHPEPSTLLAFGVATLSDLMQQGAIVSGQKN